MCALTIPSSQPFKTSDTSTPMPSSAPPATVRRLMPVLLLK